MLLCLGAEGAPQFKIGGTDEVTLLDLDGAVASTTGPLDGRGAVNVTYAFDGDSFVYTTTPTPGAANVIVPLAAPETKEERRARLSAQNALGECFFDMDGGGLPVDCGFPAVVDLRLSMDPEEAEKMREERSYALYHPFESAAVTSRDDPADVLLDLPGGGRMRPKGQSTLNMGTCEDRSIPYSVDFDRGSDPDQTLFGAGRAYLRTHFGDPSHAREWAMHRMLARFRLPHLRTRTVRLFLNEEFVGLYSLMEAPDQDYVHQRSGFDQGEGLYKVKTMSLACGADNDLIEGLPSWDQMLATAEKRLDETDTPPYLFERGDHRPKIPVLKNLLGCFMDFFSSLQAEMEDVALAYLRKNATCGEFLVDQGLIDRDLGDKELDGSMAAFINDHLAGSKCDPGCSNSDLADDVEMTNFLRNIAVMAALLHQDSPVGNGNNYYLAGGHDAPWSMVQYDHNNMLGSASTALCDPQCEDMVKWSILRPTCGAFESNQMAGPLLADPDLRAQYIEYVREFHSDVMTNETFLDQLHDHLVAIREDAMVDPWNDTAALFDLELADGEDWKHGLGGEAYVPFLPAIRARATEIRKQLEAIDEGKFPRDLEDIGEDERCVDWEAEGPRAVSSSAGCPDNCFYDGCLRPEFTVPAFCDPIQQICIHGDSDSKCEGVVDGQGYDGIKSFEGSEATPFCFTDTTNGAGALKLATCPPKQGGSGGGICGDLSLISTAAAGDSCTGGTYNLKDSNDGTTKAQCIEGGGSFDPYTCGEAEYALQNDPSLKALGDDLLNLLVTSWWRPKCCEAKDDASLICGDLALVSSAAAGDACTGGTFNMKDSNDGTTKDQCVNGGGVFSPYTCGDAESFLENDPMAKALGEDTMNLLVTSWYQPKCCENIPVDALDEDEDEDEDEAADVTGDGEEVTDAMDEKGDSTGAAPVNKTDTADPTANGENTADTTLGEEETTGTPAADPVVENKTPNGAAGSVMSWKLAGSAALVVLATVV